MGQLTQLSMLSPHDLLPETAPIKNLPSAAAFHKIVFRLETLLAENPRDFSMSHVLHSAKTDAVVNEFLEQDNILQAVKSLYVQEYHRYLKLSNWLGANSTQDGYNKRIPCGFYALAEPYADIVDAINELHGTQVEPFAVLESHQTAYCEFKRKILVISGKTEGLRRNCFAHEFAHQVSHAIMKKTPLMHPFLVEGHAEAVRNHTLQRLKSTGDLSATLESSYKTLKELECAYFGIISKKSFWMQLPRNQDPFKNEERPLFKEHVARLGIVDSQRPNYEWLKSYRSCEPTFFLLWEQVEGMTVYKKLFELVGK